MNIKFPKILELIFIDALAYETAYLALSLFVSLVSTNQRQLNLMYIMKTRPPAHETKIDGAL